ncbi:hypothetical protein PV403_17200 [Paenibacillus sp. GYB006]|uniref:hypothetical protein n=1 Tax=Paenibacillus sp. GYB006 TaxID=2994394 RepID=UPI002F96D8FD
MNMINFTKEISAIKNKSANTDEKILKVLQNKIENEYSELSVLNAEVPKSIMGKSSFKPNLLSQLIEQKEKNIAELQDQTSKIETLINSKSIEINEMNLLKEYIPQWNEVFEEASPEKKKIMLSLIIDEILVSKEMIRIDLKLHIKQFLLNSQLN